jgi:hypothetical protein
VDRGGAYSAFFAGSVGRLHTSSASGTAAQLDAQATKRVETATPYSSTPLEVNDATQAERDWTTLAAEPVYPEQATKALAFARTYASATPERQGSLAVGLGEAVPWLRARLAKSSRNPDGPLSALAVAKMTPGQLVQAAAQLPQ